VVDGRRVDRVQDANRRRIGEEYGKDQRQRGQGLFSARKQRQRRRLLARRLGNDLEAGFQRVLAFDELQLRSAAPEQLGEQPLEVIVDDLDGGEQALARLALEVLDA